MAEMVNENHWMGEASMGGATLGGASMGGVRLGPRPASMKGKARASTAL